MALTITNLNINGFDNFSCPQPKANKNAKRNSGGVIVFFKHYLNGGLDLIESDEKGFIWFKLNKEYSYLTTDTYFCCCYIPPEDSRLFRNPNALLYDVDFFDLLNNDINIVTLVLYAGLVI